jgi:hypothetical protein
MLRTLFEESFQATRKDRSLATTPESIEIDFAGRCLDSLPQRLVQSFNASVASAHGKHGQCGMAKTVNFKRQSVSASCFALGGAVR